MASEVSICNLALGWCSNEANLSSLVEQSVEAQYCAQFYPIARDRVLAAHNWNFCTKRVALAELVNDSDNWQFCYARPADCLNPICILMPESTDDTVTFDYVQELNSANAQVIRTNVEQAVLKYTKITTNVALFSPICVNAIAFLLAAYLAGPLTKDYKLQQAMMTAYTNELGKATEADSNTQDNSAYGAKHNPDFTGRD